MRSLSNRVLNLLVVLLCCLLLISPVAAQDDNPPTEETTEITVPTDSVSVTTENDPATITGWIDSLAPWAVIVVLLVLVKAQSKDNANGIPRETVDTFIDRAATGAKLTETQMDDFAVEVARKVRDMLYADTVTPAQTVRGTRDPNAFEG